MPDPRNSTALRQLSGLGRERDPPGWTWAVVTSEHNGRLSLPAAACATLGASPSVAGHTGGVRMRGKTETTPVDLRDPQLDESAKGVFQGASGQLPAHAENGVVDIGSAENGFSLIRFRT